MATLSVTTVFRWLNIDVYWRLRDTPDPGAVLEVQAGDIVAWRGCEAQVERVFDEGRVRCALLRRWKAAAFPADLVFPLSQTVTLRWPEMDRAYAAGEWRLPRREAGSFTEYPPNLLRLYPLADPAGGPRQSALRDPGITDPGALSLLERLIAQLEAAAQSRNRDGVETGLRSIEAVCRSLAQPSERAALTRLAEARLAFGLACLTLGEHSRAIEHFIQAARDYRLGADPHGEAIARWMAGDSQRAMPSTRRSESLIRCQTTVDLFHKLAEDGNRRGQLEVRWYRARLPLLRDCLLDAATARPAAPKAAPPASTAAPTAEPTQPADAEARPAPEPETGPAATMPSLAGTLMELAIQRLYSSGAKVSANAQGELVGRPSRRSKFIVATDRLLINDRPYALYDLSGGRGVGRVTPKNVVRLDMERVSLVPVSGDSMNAATPQSIDDGDYVAFRETSDPDDQAYVIALLAGEKGQEAGRYVVKYRDRNELLSLTRQPSNPADPYRPIKLGRRARLVGQVLAVLKPIT